MTIDNEAICIPEPAEEHSVLKQHARPHLNYLDGVRGFAGLWVVTNHMSSLQALVVAPPGLFGILGHYLALFFAMGHQAVPVFIVLSGFCLMLPVARQGMQLRGGARRFYYRRAHRILPPYFVCMALNLILSVFVLKFGVHKSIISPRVFLANAFLMEDIIPHTNAINGVFWSIAVEWHIYFLLPVFVYLWREFKPIIMISVAFAVGIAAVYVIISLFPDNNLLRCCPWYVILFAFGAYASGKLFQEGDKGYAAQLRSEAGRAKMAQFLLPLTLLLFALCIGWMLVFPPDYESEKTGWEGFTWNTMFFDVAVGMLVAAFLSLLTVWNAAPEKNPVGAIFESRFLVRFGIIGYSLYLMHPLAMMTVAMIMNRLHLFPSRPVLLSLVTTVFNTVSILIVCFGFHYLVEKRFLNTRVASEVGLGKKKGVPAT